jgi:hypothetical protein
VTVVGRAGQRDVIYRDELDSCRDGAEVSYALTRSQPPGRTGFSRRIDAAPLEELARPAEENPLAFICELRLET